MRKYFAFFLILIFIVGYGIYYHTNSLTISRHIIKIGDGNRKIVIAHISDLHTKGFGKLEEQIINAIKNNYVDIIAITGDIATPGGTLDGYQSVLSKLKARKGAYYIPGNWESWEPIEGLQQILKDNQIKDLTNKAHKLDEGLWLVGFDDIEEGKPNLDEVFALPKSDIKIGLFHSPKFFNEIYIHTNLNLAGHSHGGQVRIPFLGSIWTPEGTGSYDQGWFEIKNSKLFVSRGIGTSILPVRFFCSPELAIIEVRY